MEEVVSRPWGSYQVIHRGASYLVKLIVVAPFSRTSLQYHDHREEIWVVSSGVLRSPESGGHGTGSVLHVGRREVHRIENPTAEPLVLVEVQIGDYLSEDDIVRLEDDYARCFGSGGTLAG